MKKLEEFIENSEHSSFYKERIAKFTPRQKVQLEELSNKLKNEGATEPLNWAYSEVSENIAQFSRFLFLKEIFATIKDVEGNIAMADDIDQNYDENIFAITKQLQDSIGEQRFNSYLQSFTKGVLWSVLNTIDNGNYNIENKPMWNLKEEGTNRGINGLHESFMDFEDEIKQ